MAVSTHKVSIVFLRHSCTINRLPNTYFHIGTLPFSRTHSFPSSWGEGEGRGEEGRGEEGRGEEGG